MDKVNYILCLMARKSLWNVGKISGTRYSVSVIPRAKTSLAYKKNCINECD
jgi:hypothetical protein